jgi:hypothetical protein
MKKLIAIALAIGTLVALLAVGTKDVQADTGGGTPPAPYN